MQLPFESVAVKLDPTHFYLRGRFSPGPWRWAGFQATFSLLESFHLLGFRGSDNRFSFLGCFGQAPTASQPVLKILLLQPSFIHGGKFFFFFLSQLFSAVGKVGAWQTESLVWRCWLHWLSHSRPVIFSGYAYHWQNTLTSFSFFSCIIVYVKA